MAALNATGTTLSCPKPMTATSNGVFQGDNPLDYALPLAILQICLVVLLTRILAFLLRPLRQPRVIAEIVGGILLGPSALGRNKHYLDKVFPAKSLPVLDTLANLGLLFFLFLVGLELDLKSLRRTGKKALCIAAAGISLPFLLGIGTSFALRGTISKGVDKAPFLVFMGVALSITAFPVLARILAELKLLTTDVGRMAMSAAAVNDVAAWILLALAIALSGTGHSPLVSLWVFLCGSGGLKTNVATIQGLQSWGLLVLVITTACFGKIVGTVSVSLLCRMPFREAVAMGFLMNTKGLVELIVLNIGKDRKVLNDETFSIMVLMAIFTTFITTPLVIAVYKPAKRASRADYKIRKIERNDPNTQLRILACFHSTRDVPTMINLIEASRGTDRREGLCVYAMHLMELTERSSAILMVHKVRKNGLPFWNKLQQSGNNQVVVTFEAFRQLGRVSIHPTTAISQMYDMHEDICDSAERKRAAAIILPFHKHQRLDGTFETTRTEFHLVNMRVLENAQCSVGILVDRGLGGGTHVPASNVSYSVTVLFFGGRDDREALAYGARMAEHPGISLSVIRFTASPEIVGEIVRVDINDDRNVSTESTDDEFIAEFKKKIAKDSSVKYEERIVSNAAETVEAAKDFSRCNLFLVGRVPQGPVVASLNVKVECPELGPVGHLLISPDFTTLASVLVMQQHASPGSLGGSTRVTEMPGEDSET
ncbi:cation/H(+) antiporter 18-like [Populus alba x Populus x berolinensis]|nr:cation/H(+) antiporter 18-like [Populus alba x Populus x berolinensis]